MATARHPASTIQWRPVASSNVEAVGWDRAEGMYVRFHGGTVYRYAGVSRQRAVACARASLMLTVVCLWIPGPVDEAVILLVFGLVVIFWRQPLREAWASAHKTRTARALARSGAPTAPDRGSIVSPTFDGREALTASEPK